MRVELLHCSTLDVAVTAIRECYNSHDKSDNGGAKDRALVHKVGNVYKHNSTLEHLVYSFRIQGVSRLLLQEFARHRIASLSVKSTRFTLQELVGERSFIVNDGFNDKYFEYSRASKYIVFPPEDMFEHTKVYNDFRNAQVEQLDTLREAINAGIKRDIVKYLVPDSYKTNITWTVNMRSLQNFVQLRTAKGAHFEIRELAHKIVNALPSNHKYLIDEFVQTEE